MVRLVHSSKVIGTTEDWISLNLDVKNVPLWENIGDHDSGEICSSQMQASHEHVVNFRYSRYLQNKIASSLVGKMSRNIAREKLW